MEPVKLKGIIKVFHLINYPQGRKYSARRANSGKVLVTRLALNYVSMDNFLDYNEMLSSKNSSS